MPAKLGVGVIGLGIGERHAHAFTEHPHCELLAVCDHDPAKLVEVGARLPHARQMTRAKDLIDDPAIQVVSIASYDQDHHEQIVRALKAGKHVFAEKPLCMSRPELDEIRAVWTGSGLRLSTNTILRLSPRFQWLKGQIAAGEFGDVYCIEADYVYGRLHKLTEGWRSLIPDYSVMLGGGIHMVDLVLWMTGQRPVEAFAYRSGLGSRSSGYNGNDLSVALLRFSSGLIVKLSANFASVHPHFHRLMVYGTQATFENAPDLPGGAARLWRSRAPDIPPQQIAAAYPGIGKGDMLPAFVGAILGCGEPDVKEDELFDAMSVCLAIDEASATGRPTTINYD